MNPNNRLTALRTEYRTVRNLLSEQRVQFEKSKHELAVFADKVKQHEADLHKTEDRFAVVSHDFVSAFRGAILSNEFIWKEYVRQYSSKCFVEDWMHVPAHYRFVIDKYLHLSEQELQRSLRLAHLADMEASSIELEGPVTFTDVLADTDPDKDEIIAGFKTLRCENVRQDIGYTLTERGDVKTYTLSISLRRIISPQDVETIAKQLIAGQYQGLVPYYHYLHMAMPMTIATASTIPRTTPLKNKIAVNSKCNAPRAPKKRPRVGPGVAPIPLLLPPSDIQTVNAQVDESVWDSEEELPEITPFRADPDRPPIIVQDIPQQTSPADPQLPEPIETPQLTNANAPLPETSQSKQADECVGEHSFANGPGDVSTSCLPDSTNSGVLYINTHTPKSVTDPGTGPIVTEPTRRLRGRPRTKQYFKTLAATQNH